MDLIKIERVDDCLVIDSRLVSEQINVNHADWLQNVVKKYESQAQQEFGLIRFKNGEIKSKGRPEKFALLTEDQSLFFLTLSRNNEQVVKLKAKLIKSFAEARRQLSQPEINLPQNYLEALKALVASEEEKQRLLAEKEANAPLVKYAQAVQFSDDCVDFNTYAKMIGNIGRNKLMQRCRDAHVLMQNSTLPSQRWIDAGYFEVSQEINMNNGKLIPFTLITGKGQIWLKQKLDNHENLTRNAVNAIAQGVLAFGRF